jgi:hypothetical protein
MGRIEVIEGEMRQNEGEAVVEHRMRIYVNTNARNK